MSSLKVMPASSKVMPASEPKPGKIYATTEQKKTLMAIYEADNYPDSSMLEQVSQELGFSLDWVRQWFMYTRKVMRKQGKQPVQSNKQDKGKDSGQSRKRKRPSGTELQGADEEQEVDLGGGEVVGSKRRSSTKEEENLGQEEVRGRRKPKLETVAESAYKEEEDDQVEEEENLAQDQLEAGDDVDLEIEGEPQLGVELSHEEAMVKAVQYDLLKVKFDDLHEKFLTLSKAVSILDKENKVAAIMEKDFDSGIANEEAGNNTTFNPKTDQAATSTPLVPRKEKKMKEETKEEEKSSVYNPYPHMYPGHPPYPGYPPHPYMAYPGFPPAYNPPPMSDDQKMPSGVGNPALPH